MKFALFGSKGWIGNMFKIELIKQNISFVEYDHRVDNLEYLHNWLDTHSPTHLICTIGRTHGQINDQYISTIDYLEYDGKLVDNLRDNLYAPLTLMNIARERNIHMTYMGTGCIFVYDNDHPYGQNINGFTETDKPNFFGSSYSVVKGFGDEFAKQYANNVLNLRIRMPITSQNNPRNFITKIIKYEKICNVPNSMTVMDIFVPLFIDMAIKNVTGTYNCTNPGLISHNEILELYKTHVDANFTWKNMTIEEQDSILKAARSNNYLDTSKIENLYPDLLDINSAVEQCLRCWKPT